MKSNILLMIFILISQSSKADQSVIQELGFTQDVNCLVAVSSCGFVVSSAIEYDYVLSRYNGLVQTVPRYGIKSKFAYSMRAVKTDGYVYDPMQEIHSERYEKEFPISNATTLQEAQVFSSASCEAERRIIIESIPLCQRAVHRQLIRIDEN